MTNACQLNEHPERLSLLEPVEQLVESSHYDVWLARCQECGGLYVGCFIEIWDDSWIFYARIQRDEGAMIRADSERARELISARRHIVWPPSWKGVDPFWSEDPDLALLMGPRA